MTAAAQEFVTPLAVGALSASHVYTDLFSREDEQDVGHIRLARDCDLVLVAPASADLLAKMANGLANDLASTILLATAKPLSPTEIQQRGQVFCHDLGLVTVYRTLELMDELEMVRAVHLADGCHGYVLSTPGHTHHVVCERCHAVIEVIGCELGDFLDTVATRTGYQITGHWLEISGVCADCQKEPPQDA